MTKVINLSCLFFMFSGDPFYECVFFFLAKTLLYILAPLLPLWNSFLRAI